MPDAPAGPPDSPPNTLRSAGAVAKWIGPTAFAGVVLLIVALVLAFAAPSPLWFLLYPVLIVGAVGALATTAAWLLRRF